MRKFFLLLSCILSLSACSTIEGLGRDVSGGARTIQGWF
ncbi:MAG: entericidin EcnA/B family protein [Paracoccaceae bacterium]|nr:entericidin EcnA/B family protein [Paracoccaceae bacterium]MDG1736463.1 entericidin EcnA/B family protein [Paracoccaceae bacterium]MDG2259124.1 entericidin EcnA/B family protein [Paracoccaceae bacterium]